MALELVKQLESNNMLESPYQSAYVADDVLHVLDETLVPEKLKYIPVKNIKGAVAVIREMKTRAFGQFLVVLNTFLLELEPKRIYLSICWMLPNSLIIHVPYFLLRSKLGIVTGVAQREKRHQDCSGIPCRYPGPPFAKGAGNIRGDEGRGLHLDALQCQWSKLAMAATEWGPGKTCEVFRDGNQAVHARGQVDSMGIAAGWGPVTLVADNAIGSLMADGLINKVIKGIANSRAKHGIDMNRFYWQCPC